MNIVDDLNQKTEELEDANTRLHELDRLKSMFIASMSHELRTPLNSIIGFSSIIKDEWIGPVNAEQKENLDTIQRSGKHLLSLINDVIDVSKIEAGRIEPHFEEFDLYDLLMEAVQYVEKDLDDKGLQLRIDICHDIIFTDRRRLLQSIINLLSNAVKFTEQGWVTVSAAVNAGTDEGNGEKTLNRNGTVIISISDTGVGIAEEDILRLFQPFVRLVSSLTTTVPGTGLGLYLTRKLVVDVLGGDILCKSDVGVGSSFTLRIPERIYEKGAGSRG
jgi:signal transduction histidine kinase